MENKQPEKYEMNWERYEKALSKILKDFVNKGYETISVEEIWIETSLPKDLIIELIQNRNVEFPEELTEITYKNEAIWSSNKE